MLLEYGFRNFLSFKEGVSVSFRLDANVPTAISDGKPYSRIMCVKGANGSGKTHLLKGLAFMASFVNSSFNSPPDAEIQVDPFFGSTDPCYFYAQFTVGTAEYLYELEVSADRVHREVLYETKRRKTKIFERVDDAVVHAVKRVEALKTVKIRKNASIISTAYQHEIAELIPAYHFFESFWFNVTSTGISDTVLLEISSASKFCHENPPILAFVTTFIKTCDIGISDIKILKEFDDHGKPRFFPVFYHTVDGQDIAVPPATESSGTKQLFRYLIGYALVLATGGFLILDEFDLYLHPHILPKLLSLFDGATNPKEAQFLFTTHNTEILDYCGKYQTYFVNKENNESYAYRLDELPGDILRNDRSLLPPYNDGKIGGVPKI